MNIWSQLQAVKTVMKNWERIAQRLMWSLIPNIPWAFSKEEASTRDTVAYRESEASSSKLVDAEGND